jgi:Ca2+-binding RTX toxin-like protein
VADTIYGRGGNDTLRADRFTRDNDRLYGNRGRDTLDTEDGDARDLAAGGRGNDTCYVDDGDRYRSCETLYIDGDLQ